MSVRTSDRCIAHGKNGQRCKKRTAMTPYCWIHLQAQKHLRVKPSEVEDGGLGLYTTAPVPAGQVICKYGGDRIENHDPDYGGPYVLELKDTDPFVYMDGKRSSKRIGAFANHPPHGRPANALFDKLPDLSDGTVVAKRPIAAGREIFVNYGGDYWNGGLKKQAPKRLNDDEVEEELDRVMALLPEGVQLALPAYQRRRRNEGRRAAVLSDAWRARENRRQLAEAQAALVRHRKKVPAASARPRR